MMNLLRDKLASAGSATRRRLTVLLTILVVLCPAFASAGEGNVVLNFTNSDKMFLWISVAIGAVSLVFAWLLAKKVLAQDPGTEKMQEVSAAIKEGALAYLRQQISTMIWFVIALAVGLFALYAFYLYKDRPDAMMLGVKIGLTFFGGVSASYIAGYAGMLMAVEGNKRTASAALRSYKATLEVAFHSGAVAGLVTVGMGLIGAALILLFTGADAMKLLVGFGFGGSLAALFMRVGGGIFTKAADVGADLVGKVEAGIPEDDPRNPATIADNVGDNVGDCAGMAADVFESYEVTLVAAIVLGAATASIFDQPTWMKLVLFALMARGVGIVASIIGIYSVKGSDNIDSDPLKAIRKGFWAAAGIATVFTAGLAFFMLGPSSAGGGIKTTRLVPVEQYQRDKMASIKDAITAFTKANGSTVETMDYEAFAKSAEFKALGLEEERDKMAVEQAKQFDADRLGKVPSFQGYSPVDWNSETSKAARYAMQAPPVPGQSEANYKLLKDEYATEPLFVFQVKVTQIPDPKTAPDAKETTQELWIGPLKEKMLSDQITSAEQGGRIKVKWYKNDPTLGKSAVHFFENAEGKLVLGIDKGSITEPDKVTMQGVSYYADSPANLKDRDAKRASDPKVPFNTPQTISSTIIEQTPVPWYLFFFAIFFGIILAFFIELLTDYYVSTHRKPVQEVAGVSSAGPAPMIIQGFALALESSVFMVFTIVIALMFPLLIFPAAVFGGPILSFYGIALVGLGLLTTTGFILAMDTFGPISDNAQGVFEMSGAGHESESGSKAVQRLDAAGNTTKALTKGFAIATAVVAAVALFHSYIEDAMLAGRGLPLDAPTIFLGLLIGGAAPYLFSAFSINAVGRAAFQLINEVRRQFRSDPGIMAGTSKPNYGSCVAIVTAAAQKELLGPAILAIALPLAVAFGFSIGQAPVTINGNTYNLVGAQALGGFLAGAILSGQLMAVLLANAGGIWDNAKKLIEDGLYGGKGSEAHKAGIVCDTVGDPFKDTAGPALNPLIKVMNLVALLLAPVIIKPLGNPVLIVITVVCIAALAFSIWWSKRGSMSDGLNQAQDDGGTPPPPVDKRKRITVEDAAEEAVPAEKA